MRSRTQSFSLTHDRVVVYQHGDGMRSGEQPGTDGAIFAGQHGRQRWGSGPRGEIGHPPWQGVPPAGTDVPAGTEPLRIILLRERHIQIPVPARRRPYRQSSIYVLSPRAGTPSGALNASAPSPAETNSTHLLHSGDGHVNLIVRTKRGALLCSSIRVRGAVAQWIGRGAVDALSGARKPVGGLPMKSAARPPPGLSPCGWWNAKRSSCVSEPSIGNRRRRTV